MGRLLVLWVRPPEADVGGRKCVSELRERRFCARSPLVADHVRFVGLRINDRGAAEVAIGVDPVARPVEALAQHRDRSVKGGL